MNNNNYDEIFQNKLLLNCGILGQDYHTDWFQAKNREGNLTWKGYWEVTDQYKPKSILEIGPRTGYSIMAMLCACEPAIITTIDNESYIPNSNLLLEYNLKTCIEKLEYNTKFVIMKADTQQENLSRILSRKKINPQKYDLISIDGDHSLIGVTNDIEQSYRILDENGIILIDDYNYINDIKLAVEEFVNKYKNDIKFFEVKKTFRGLAVIKF